MELIKFITSNSEFAIMDGFSEMAKVMKECAVDFQVMHKLPNMAPMIWRIVATQPKSVNGHVETAAD